MKWIAGLLAGAIFCLSATGLWAQVTRSTLSGQVTDPSGAVVPNVEVTATSVETGARTNTKSGTSGFYTIPFLAPGHYSLSATAAGFQKFRRTGITLETGQSAMINIGLQLGSSTQTVVVHAATPLIDTATATSGQVLSQQEVESLPSNGRSPIGFARDEYGVIPKEKHALTKVRPFDNSGGSDFAMGGGNSQSNEVLLNGVPNMQDQTRVSAFSPNLDAVSEIRADDFESSAAYGDTSNGIVNITTKSGTNQFHGTASEFNETSALAARLYFQRPGEPVPATRQNQFGLTFGGPVWIPKVYNGRNKMFFFYAFEGFLDSTPSAVTTTVPTPAERKGDFSQLLALNTSKTSYQLYNPFQASSSHGVITRQPFPDNMIPSSLLNPVGQALLSYYPAPNLPGEPDGEDNYFSNSPTTDKYYSNMGRLDYTFSSRNKAYFEIHQSTVTTDGGNYFNNIATGKSSKTNWWGGSVDDVQTFSPTLTLNNRFGWTRSYATGALPSTGFDPAKLGFPSYISSKSPYHAMPQMNISGFQTLGGKPGSVNGYTNLQYFAMLTKVWGRHTLEIGPDIRAQKYGGLSPDYASGRYYFTSNWVKQSSTSNAPQFGSGLAELLLGLPDGGNNEFNINAPTFYSNFYFAGYIQDNWHVKRNLTLNLGLRVEHETPVVESRNRMNAGFDPAAVNQVTAPAEAAYAAHPIPELPADQFKPIGGLVFAAPSHRNSYDTAAAYWSPRFGFAWAPGDSGGKTVFRGGVGIFYNPLGVSTKGPAAGFQATNKLVPTTDGYLTPAATLSDPYPSANPLQEPTGSSLGGNTFLGQDISYIQPHFDNTNSIRWSFDIQHSFGNNTMFDLGYIGSRQRALSINNDVSALPVHYLSKSNVYDPVVTGELSKQVASPFHGLGPQYGKTTSVANLLKAYPEFSSVTRQKDAVGYGNYHMLGARLTHRFSHGLQFNTNFEWSRQLNAASQLNPGGPLWYGTTTGDFPIHFVISGRYELPFGRGKMYLAGINRWGDELVGGWAISSIYVWESGAVLSWNNAVIHSWNDLGSQPRNLARAFNVDNFDGNSKEQPNSYNYRTFPSYLFRSDATNNADLSAFKNFNFADKAQLQYRLDAFNAFNRPQFAAANTTPTSSAFGQIKGQANTSRVIQMGLRLNF